MALKTFERPTEWSPSDWVNHGGELLEVDANIAKRFISKGIQKHQA